MSTTINGTTSTYWTFKAEVTESNPSVENNTSDVLVEVYIGRASGAGQSYFQNADIDFIYTVDGQVYTEHYHGSEVIDAGSYKKIVYHTFTVQHNNDGSKTISVSVSFNNDISPESGNLIGTVTLSQIVRASTPSFANPFTIGDNLSINMNRSASTFTHTLEYSGDGTDYTQFATNVGESYSWDTSVLYPICKYSDHLTGYIRSTTYNGATQVGSPSIVSFTGNVSAQGNTPDVSVSHSIDNTAIPVLHRSAFSGTIIQDISKITFTITGTAKHSAEISKYYVNGKECESSVEVIPNTSGSVPYTITVTDSRGFSNHTTVDLNIEAYTAPRIIQKPGNSRVMVGRAIYGLFDPQGTKLRMEFARSVFSVGGANKSTVSCTIVGEQASTTLLDENDSDVFSGDLPGRGSNYLNISDTYTIKLTVSDYVTGDVDYEYQIPVGFATLHLAEGGTGVGIGMYHDPLHANGLDVGFDAYFDENVAVDKNTYFGGKIYIYDGNNYVDVTSAILGLVNNNS